MSITKLIKEKEKQIGIKYPKARRDRTVIDFYGNVKIRDPYRWLEDPHSIETRDFVVKQNDISQSYLEDFLYRDSIKEKAKQFFNYPRRSIPVRKGTKYYQRRNSGLLNQDVLYASDTIDSEGWAFLDPNKISTDGTASLRFYEFSANSEYMCYAISISGSEWVMFKIRNTRTGEDLPETLYKIKNSKISWTKYDTGFFYSGYLSERDITYFGIHTKRIHNQKLYYHRLQQDQDTDVIVAEFEDPDMMVTGKVSNCGNYLVVYAYKDIKNNMVYMASLAGQEEENYTGLILVPLVKDFNASYNYVMNRQDLFLFRTDQKAPNYRLTVTNFNYREAPPKEYKFHTIIKEHPKHILQWAKPVNFRYLLVCYIVDAEHRLEIFTWDGNKMMDVKIIPGTITDVSGEYCHDEIFFSVTSWFVPYIIYRLNLQALTPETTILYEAKIQNVPLDSLEFKKTFYQSKDGTEIPMCLLYKKGVCLDDHNPCVLTAYGGFSKSLTPYFNPVHAIFALYFYGVCAIANVRGGGEYGQAWHQAGCGRKKQNSFDDFIYAAKYLVDNNVTKPNLLAITGDSNGGLLVGTALNQSPELYSSAVISVGVLDMLRFDKFTSGFTWVYDYGSPNNKEDFDCLSSYSPLHNINQPANEQVFPGVLIFTADHDDVVVPAHSLKYVAELQYKIGGLPQQKKPLLLKVVSKVGHGLGKPTSKHIDEVVDTLTFLAKTLNLKFYEM